MTDTEKSTAERWGEFRFSVIGHLLSAPPCRGELQATLEGLSTKRWRHPITGKWVSFGLSTIERWYYQALRERRSPVQRLARRVRSDRGASRRISERATEALTTQYHEHPSWSKKLHSDNLAVVLSTLSQPEPVPSYQTVVRFMNAQGFVRR